MGVLVFPPPAHGCPGIHKPPDVNTILTTESHPGPQNCPSIHLRQPQAVYHDRPSKRCKLCSFLSDINSSGNNRKWLHFPEIVPVRMGPRGFWPEITKESGPGGECIGRYGTGYDCDGDLEKKDSVPRSRFFFKSNSPPVHPAMIYRPLQKNPQGL